MTNQKKISPGLKIIGMLVGVLFFICCLCPLMFSAGQSIGIFPTTAPTPIPPTDLPKESTTPTIQQPAASPTLPASAAIDLALLKCTSASGADFCLATGTITTNIQVLEATMRQYCQNKDTALCDINAWADKNNLPKDYPLTDQQLAAQLAQYKKNTNTGHDCFILFLHEKQIYRSSGCTDPTGSAELATPAPTDASKSPDAYLTKYGGDRQDYVELLAITDCEALQRKLAIVLSNFGRETKTPDPQRLKALTGRMIAAQDQLSTLACPTPTPTHPYVAQPTAADNCNAAYPDLCLTYDQTCTEIGVHNFRVLPPDPYSLDRDNDGLGCEQ